MEFPGRQGWQSIRRSYRRNQEKADDMAGNLSVNVRMSGADWLLLVLLSVLWGGSFFFVGVLVKALPAFTIVFLRVGLAAVILHVFVRASGAKMPRDLAPWRAFLGMALLNNVVPFCLIVWAQGHIASGLAAILNATTPISTVIVAHFLTDDEKMTGNRLFGVMAGFVGVIILMGADSLKGLGVDVWAQAAVLLGAVSYAFAGVYGRRFRRLGIAPIATATGQVTVSTFLLFPLAMIVDTPWTLAMPSWPVWAAASGLALFSTAIGYVLYFRLLASAGATNLLLVTFLIPISAILMGSLGLGEHLEIRHFVGLAVIGAGLAAIDGRLLTPRSVRNA
jgi:drug/metabolite transporter (DMT)-like permease